MCTFRLLFIAVIGITASSSSSSSSSSTNFIATQVLQKLQGGCVSRVSLVSMLLLPVVCVAVWSTEQFRLQCTLDCLQWRQWHICKQWNILRHLILVTNKAESLKWETVWVGDCCVVRWSGWCTGLCMHCSQAWSWSPTCLSHGNVFVCLVVGTFSSCFDTVTVFLSVYCSSN